MNNIMAPVPGEHRDEYLALLIRVSKMTGELTQGRHNSYYYLATKSMTVPEVELTASHTPRNAGRSTN